ncbi:chemotaxis protein CheY, partial [Saccharothrix sp. ST-888]
MADTTDGTLTSRVYGEDRSTRGQVTLALGRRPGADLPELRYLECATVPAVLKGLGRGGIDLCI